MDPLIFEGILRDIKESIDKGSKRASDTWESIKETVLSIRDEAEEFALMRGDLRVYTNLSEKVINAGFGTLMTSLKDWVTMDREKAIKNILNIEPLANALMEYYETQGDPMLDRLKRFDNIMRDANVAIGMTNVGTSQMRENFERAYVYTSRLNIGIEQLAKYQSEFSEELRTSVPLLQKELEAVALLEKSMAYENFNKYLADVLKYGNSFKNVEKVSSKMLKDSAMFGLNVRNMTKQMDSNLKEAQRINFQNGLSGLADMVRESEKLKFNINETAGAIDKARDLEGAFEMATSLQMLGKNIDPLRLNYLANYDPTEFAREINSLISTMGTLNKVTGEMVYSPVEQRIMIEMSKVTNASVESMKEQALMLNKVGLIQRSNLGISKEEAEFLANISRFEDGRLKVMNSQNELVGAELITRQEIARMRKAETDLAVRASKGISFKDLDEATKKMNEANMLMNMSIEGKLDEYYRSIKAAEAAFGADTPEQRALAQSVGLAMTKMMDKSMQMTGDKFMDKVKLAQLMAQPVLFDDKYIKEGLEKGKNPMWESGKEMLQQSIKERAEVLESNKSVADRTEKAIRESYGDIIPKMEEAVKRGVLEGMREGMKGADMGGKTQINMNVTESIGESFLNKLDLFKREYTMKGYVPK